ncbi:MAG: capsule assembly Wzi family protein [Nitrospira sp.]|nr:capsule assembly Wzi family protein [Nitrospira sp.]
MRIKDSNNYLCVSVSLWLFILITVASVVNPFPAQSAMSFHIPLHSSLEEDVQTLQGMGYMDEVFTGFRPYSRLEIARAFIRLRDRLSEFPLEDITRQKRVSAILERIERELKKEIDMSGGSVRPSVEINQVEVQSVFLDGTFTNRGTKKESTFQGLSIKNNEGRPYENGLNIYGDITLTSQPADSILLYLNPEVQYLQQDVKNESEIDRMVIQEGYVKYHTSLSDIMVGKVPLWWGQGYNGALLLSDNIEPLTMIRLYKESPYEISLPFKQKGLISYDFFVSRLEHNRELPDPIFWGLRLGFKPVSSWEIGIARTAIFGGGDRPVNLHSIFNSVTGLGENTSKEAGDQIAGFDTSYKGRLWKQPFLIYAEMYGEDQAGLFPSKYAGILGLHLPEIFGLNGNALRVEYADDSGLKARVEKGMEGVWYNHHIYTDGYTYKGRIMGHGMGTDADNFLAKWEKYLSADAKGFLSFERNRLGLFQPSHWEIRDYSAGIELNPGRGRELNLRYTLQKVYNADFNPGKDYDNHEFGIDVRLLF